ncbi:MAG: hypothetical protein ACX94C_07650 [Phycisphaerales bacterium]
MCSQISTGLAFVNVAGGSSQVSSWDPQLVDAEVAGNLFAADSWEWLWNNRDPDNPTLKRGNRGFRYNAATTMALWDADLETNEGGSTFDIDNIAEADVGTGNVETTIEVADLTAAGDWLMPSGDWSAINVVPPHEVPGAYWDFRGLLRDESAATWLMGAVGATPIVIRTTPGAGQETSGAVTEIEIEYDEPVVEGTFSADLNGTSLGPGDIGISGSTVTITVDLSAIDGDATLSIAAGSVESQATSLPGGAFAMTFPVAAAPPSGGNGPLGAMRDASRLRTVRMRG